MDHSPATWITSLGRFLATASQPASFLDLAGKKTGSLCPVAVGGLALRVAFASHDPLPRLFCTVPCTAAAAGLGAAHSPVPLRGGLGSCSH
nr:unnamed protein product [Digitaria exilis]